MSRASQSTPIHSGRRRRSRSEERSPALLGLSKRFDRFRLEHPPGTRVPGELREATLTVLSSGVAPGDLYRTCGVSWSQVTAWKAARPTAMLGGAEPAGVRVFSVVDEEPDRGPEPTVSTTAPELELRLGPWTVSVRIAGPLPAGRGDTCSL